MDLMMIQLFNDSIIQLCDDAIIYAEAVQEFSLCFVDGRFLKIRLTADDWGNCASNNSEFRL